MTGLLLVVLVPLGGAAATALVGRSARPVVGLASSIAALGAAITLAGHVWRHDTVVFEAVVLPGLDLVLVADGLAVAMVLMTSAVGIGASAYAVAHHQHAPDEDHEARWPLWLLLWAALHALFVAGDLFTTYLMLEVIALAGAALVGLGGDARTLRAATRYFLAELAASATFLVGVALVWAETGTVVIAALPADLATRPLGAAGMAVMTAGLLLKVPLVPLHFWLPPAHSLAPSSVSPVLSALVVKSAFAVLIRLWFVAAPGGIPVAAVQLLGALGVAAIVWGSVNALRASRVKLLIAHSTVAQLGYLFLLPPMVHAGAWEAWSGGIVHGVAHALAKAAALIAAALLVRSVAGETVADLNGAAARRPLAVFAFGVASLSLVGLPPSGGFVAKWYLLTASFETGQWWWAPVIVVGSLLSAAYLMRIVKQAFAPDDGPPVTPTRDARDIVCLVLALGSLALGLRPTELLTLLEIGAPLVAPGGG